MKQKVENLRLILATMFMSVNKNHEAMGTGLTYKYENKPYENEDGSKGWLLSMSVKEAGHGERILQSYPFEKKNGQDRYTMEYNVLISLFCIFADTTLTQYNEIGKMLNVDPKMQEKARTVIKEKPLIK